MAGAGLSCHHAAMRSEKDVLVIMDRAREEMMIFIGPDHPYYPLLYDLVSAIPDAWQQGYNSHQAGRSSINPYRWNAAGS
jgi:hypothetical protein